MNSVVNNKGKLCFCPREGLRPITCFYRFVKNFVFAPYGGKKDTKKAMDESIAKKPHSAHYLFAESLSLTFLCLMFIRTTNRATDPKYRVATVANTRMIENRIVIFPPLVCT
jgi:hypothetical protein